MRTLISSVLLVVTATWLSAAEPKAGTPGSSFQFAKSSGPHKYKFSKPGKYKRPKIQAKKWKASKEQRKAAEKHPLGRARI